METKTTAGAVPAYVQTMVFLVLGSVEVDQDGATGTIGGPKQRTVLALLIASVGRPVLVDVLIEGLYGEDAPRGAKRTIHTYVSNLRREIGDVIARSGDGYVLDVDPTQVDAVRFERLYADGARLLSTAPQQAASTLRSSLEIWRGHPYEDVEVRTTLGAEIGRLEELRLAALEARIEADLALGLHRDLIAELAALVSEHPLRESYRAHHMLALYRAGRQSEALRAFARAREELGTELGIEPSPELQKLEQQILDQDPALDVTAPVSIERRAVVAVELDEDARLHGTGRLDAQLSRRNEILANAASTANGHLLDIRGTAVYAAFPDVSTAIDAARLLIDGASQVAIDYGDLEVGESTAAGPVVTRSLRLAAIAHAGQVLISEDAQARLATEDAGGWSVTALGRHDIRGLDGPVQVFQLVGQGFEASFPALRLDRLPPPLPGLTAGSVPGYELRAELGGGVLGPVHRAYQPGLGREVAVRVIRPELVADPRFVRRFEALALQIAAVDHPHVVPLLDYWREPSHAFLVHRLVGTSRLEAVRSEPVNPGAVMETLRQVGAAVAAGHDRGVAHGRVQPSNVVVDSAGYAYLADLGLAVMFEDMAQASANAYTAPELIGGGASVAGDVYSLGVLAAEMLSGASVPVDGPVPTVGDAAVDAAIGRATSPLPEERHESVRQFISELAAALPVVAADQPAERRERSDVRNPFKGLLAFTEADTADFFGRSALVHQLAELVERQSFTLVVGPSGIGKSSLVRAGVVPTLRAGDAVVGGWLVTDMFPGARPFDALEAALTRVARRPPADRVEALRSGTVGLAGACSELLDGDRLMIVVDQFEELFTHTVDEDTRRRFLGVLAGVAAQPPGTVRVVATIRADFLDQPLLYADFGGIVDSATLAVPTPGRDEIREIIVGPCQRVGVDIDGALTESIVSDVGEEPGALPLLQHALTELFEQRTSDRLTTADYEAVGGLAGSIGRRAEAVFAGLAPEDQEAARDLFLHLVTIGVDEEPVRRRIRLTDLDQISGHGSTERIVDAFGRHRLLVFDRDPVTRVPTIEVAHEALLARWDRLAGWIDESREDLLVGRRLEVATGEWEAAERDESYLLTGAQLGRALTWREESGLPMAAGVGAFLEASDTADQERRADQRRRRRALLTGISAAALIAGILAIAAWMQRSKAVTEETRRAAEVLAAESELNQTSDPDLSVLLAIEAVELSKSVGDVPGRISGALQSALASHSITNRHPGGFHVEEVPGTNTYLTPGPDGTIARWDAASSEIWDVISGPDGRFLFEAIVPDSGQDWFVVVEGDDTDTVMAYDPDAGSWSVLPGTDEGGTFAVDPSGRTYAVARDDRISVWDNSSGQTIWSGEAAWFDLPSLSWDGRLAYAVREAGIGLQSDLPDDPDREFSVDIVDLESGEPIQRISGLAGDAAFLSFSPDGQSLLVSSWTFQMLFDLSDGSELTADDRVWERTDITRAWQPEWLAGGDLIGVGGLGAYSLLDPVTGLTVREFFGHEGGALEATLFPDLDVIVTAGASDEQTVVHEMSAVEGAELASFEVPAPQPISMGVATDGESMIIQYPNEFHIVDADSGELRHSRTGTWVFPVFPAGARFAAFTDDDASHMVDTATGETVYTAPDGWHIIGMSPDGDRLTMRTNESEATRLVHRSTGAAFDLDAGDPGIHSVFTTDGRYALTGNEGNERLWDAADGRLLSSWGPGPIELIGTGVGAEFTSDGEFLVLRGGLGDLMVFDMDRLVQGVPFQEAEVLRLSAHTTFIVRVVFSPDDRLVATTAWDERVRVWDIETGDLVWEFGDTDLNAVAFHPELDRIYVAEGDGVAVYTYDVNELLDIARQRVTRDLTALECRTYLGRECQS